MSKPKKSSASDNGQVHPLAERKNLTFEQAEGVDPLPAQLKLKELSPAFRAAAWDMMLRQLEFYSVSHGSRKYVSDPWETILRQRHVYRLHLPADEFTESFYGISTQIKELMFEGEYVQVLGFLEYVIRHEDCPEGFAEHVDRILGYAMAAYRVVDKTIMPIGSETEKQTVERAFADLAANEFHGARKHLRSAAEELTAGKNADSIRESIHAVESVVSILEPDGDFAKALSKLEAKTNIHGAMKVGFIKLYGFTSNEQGIRHPLLDIPAANVDETDALFMIGACSAFVSYLINKARAAGLLTS